MGTDGGGDKGQPEKCCSTCCSACLQSTSSATPTVKHLMSCSTKHMEQCMASGLRTQGTAAVCCPDRQTQPSTRVQLIACAAPATYMSQAQSLQLQDLECSTLLAQQPATTVISLLLSCDLPSPRILDLALPDVACGSGSSRRFSGRPQPLSHREEHLRKDRKSGNIIE